MKILGEKSLSSKVELGLEILFIVIALIDIAVLGILGLVTVSEFTRYELILNQVVQIILIIITLTILLLTGIIALYIIMKFIKIFKNLKENKSFNRENILYLSRISILSTVMGILYFVILLSLTFFIKLEMCTMGEKLLLKLLIFIFAIGFLVFGIGIKILNEIYKKAIEYKEENELTI